MAFFHFSTREAVAISLFVILLVSLVRFIYNFRQRHPNKDAVVIDYNLAIVMQPTIILGTFLGVLVNVSFPALIIQICLTISLIWLTITSLLELIKRVKQENKDQVKS